ncbi:MAG: DUF6114 domain-containing protein [Brevibacterium sp.]|uniref:DUF6114 domain-containing protein n=1 Tax=Brevibacterium sp. TaxID=1701 RepID=UPI002649EA30|nr:DUF6114 domain-containing protein [Brevibacterium sp.]MDN5807721.1 DUF6114 domain-containing protein [Brevibacterium sp.]MDN5834642.1 DUF6114 domain-containing protein [Brevibacterium sp.]MDN5876815.1 DUF6114 domain-containing protein [Brevibacterium sp.]MDN5910344.1 DUF6114 domain-containing protein [Brevibacterium sp.]MDN6134719.1 DUF6114 domain-containing protein [Brevibacterium sp.]
MKEASANGPQSGVLAVSRRSRRTTEQAAAEADQPQHVDEGTQRMDDTQRMDPIQPTDDAEPTDGTERTEQAGQKNDAEVAGEPKKPRRFRSWRRQRPFIGGVLVALGGIELFFSGQLDIGNLQIQFGIEGLQATVIPIALVVLALSAIFRPTHHMFYGIIALVLAVYSLIGVNLGGFILGMLLSTIGAILVVAWMGPREPKSDARVSDAHGKDAQAPAAERREDTVSADEEGTT